MIDINETYTKEAKRTKKGGVPWTEYKFEIASIVLAQILAKE